MFETKNEIASRVIERFTSLLASCPDPQSVQSAYVLEGETRRSISTTVIIADVEVEITLREPAHVPVV